MNFIICPCTNTIRMSLCERCHRYNQMHLATICNKNEKNSRYYIDRAKEAGYTVYELNNKYCVEIYRSVND